MSGCSDQQITLIYLSLQLGATPNTGIHLRGKLLNDQATEMYHIIALLTYMKALKLLLHMLLCILRFSHPSSHTSYVQLFA